MSLVWLSEELREHAYIQAMQCTAQKIIDILLTTTHCMPVTSTHRPQQLRHVLAAKRLSESI